MSSAGVGKVYDLQSLYDRLNRLYFDQSLSVHVKWSNRSVRRARRRILLGSYNEKNKTITISKRLDNIRVPLFFLEHILFHEMLHAVFPSEKHRMHTETFRRYEKMHPDFERALQWEKASVEILFSAAQKALPF